MKSSTHMIIVSCFFIITFLFHEFYYRKKPMEAWAFPEYWYFEWKTLTWKEKA